MEKSVLFPKEKKRIKPGTMLIETCYPGIPWTVLSMHAFDTGIKEHLSPCNNCMINFQNSATTVYILGQ